MARSQIGGTWSIGSVTAGSIVSATRTITAGSLVIIAWRYEGNTFSVTSVADSNARAADGWWEYAGDVDVGHPSGYDPTVGMAYWYNHPGGTDLTFTLTKGTSEATNFVNFVGVEFTGSDSTDPLYALTPPSSYGDVYAAGKFYGEFETSPSLGYIAATDVAGLCFAMTGYYSSSSITPTSGSTSVLQARTYSSLWYRSHTGGSNTISATGGSGNTSTMILVFDDPASSASKGRMMLLGVG